MLCGLRAGAENVASGWPSARELGPGEEIAVSSNPSPEWDDAPWPYEVTFDGGARRVGESWVAGAGATLWEHRLNGGAPRRLAIASVAIPWAANAQIAEAIGCRAALGLLLSFWPWRKSVRVVGDDYQVLCGKGKA